MKMREAIIAALRGDSDLVPKMKESWRERIDEEKGPMSTVVQAAEALEPIIADAVDKRPSKLGKFGLKSAHLLASLTMEDDKSNRKLARIAKGKTLGIVFVDIAGFTTYTARRGDEAARTLIARLDRIVSRVVRSCKGECVKHLGDGFLLAFPSASQAVRAAVELRDEARRVRAEDRTFEVALRIAVHAGEPLVEQDDLLGHDVNLTARLLDHCRPGEVIVSEAAKELSAKRLRTIAFGKRRVIKIRGLSTKVVTYVAEKTVSDRATRTRSEPRPRARAL
jgi:class 3 adenylate cyclase